MIVDVNAIVLRLIDTATVAAPSAEVLDGRDYSKALEKHVVLIGYAGNPMEAVVTVSRAIDQGSLCDTQFDVVVRGVVAVWDGEEEFTAKRAIVQQTVSQLNDAVEADRSLGGIAYDAWMAPEQSWFQVADTEGNSVECEFTITVRVYA